MRWKLRQASDEHWVGMNCAACHTGEIRYRDVVMRVEGGAAMADFQGFLEALDDALDALDATAAQPDKFARFAAKALGADDDPDNRDLLRAALDQLIAWEHRIARMRLSRLRDGNGHSPGCDLRRNRKRAGLIDTSEPAEQPRRERALPKSVRARRRQIEIESNHRCECRREGPRKRSGPHPG